jgi:hypothetical protein
MTMSPGFRNFLWMTAGASVFLAVWVAAMRFYKDPDCAGQFLFKAKRIELVGEMREALASASEAEKSAVMAITDSDSQIFADQARVSSALVENKSTELMSQLDAGGTGREKDVLAQFSQAFAELKRIDYDLLSLAVQNSNVKAYNLAFGPAVAELNKMDVALSKMMAENADSASASAKQIMLLASIAQSAALRIQTYLAPHVAEENDQKMDELETMMTNQDQKVRSSLRELVGILGETPDLKTALSRYAQHAKLRAQIIKLSRENTNVRSLSISLNQKRKAMFACQAALTTLEQAIQEEPTETMNCGIPANPRKI